MSKDKIRGLVEDSKRSVEKDSKEFAGSIKKELESFKRQALERLG